MVTDALAATVEVPGPEPLSKIGPPSIVICVEAVVGPWMTTAPDVSVLTATL